MGDPPRISVHTLFFLFFLFFFAYCVASFFQSLLKSIISAAGLRQKQTNLTAELHIELKLWSIYRRGSNQTNKFFTVKNEFQTRLQAEKGQGFDGYLKSQTENHVGETSRDIFISKLVWEVTRTENCSCILIFALILETLAQIASMFHHCSSWVYGSVIFAWKVARDSLRVTLFDRRWIKHQPFMSETWECNKNNFKGIECLRVIFCKIRTSAWHATSSIWLIFGQVIHGSLHIDSLIY